MLPLAATLALAAPTVYQVGSDPLYPTVGDAVAAASDGDTIEVDGAFGPYVESVDLGDRDLEFTAVNAPHLVAADPTNGFAFVHGAADIGFTGFDIDGAGNRAFLVQGGTLRITGSAVHDTADSADDGGAIRVEIDGYLDLVDVSFARSSVGPNSAGGFVWVDALASLYASGCTFEGGYADNGGGAIACVGGCTIEDSTFVGNATASNGGAIVSVGQFSVARSRFCSNGAAMGGALLVLDVDGAVVNRSVFALNSAADGGAIWALADLDVTHSDFLGNVASNTGAAIGIGYGTLSAHNDVFVDHDAPIAVNVVFEAGLVDLAYNLYDNALTDTNSLGGIGPGAVVNQDPLFTRWDHVDCVGADLTLGPYSPAIDAGDPGELDTDLSVTDIGAFGPYACVPGVEYPGDGVDGDCDGWEACYPDADLDGFGESGSTVPGNLWCSPPNAPDDDDQCIGGDDNVDTDGDGLPDDCDDLPFGTLPTTDTGIGSTGGSDADVDADADADTDVDSDADADADADVDRKDLDPVPGGLLSSGTCGCATGGPSGGLLVVLAAMVGVSRRRR